MTSPLSPATRALLATAREREPLFSNQIGASLFEERHKSGPYKLLPSTAGGYVVFDTRAALGAGVVSPIIASEDEAHAALEAIAERKA